MMAKRWIKNVGFAVLMIGNTAAMGSCMWMIHADANQRCIQRWAESSTPSKVTKAGCMVEKSPDNWVPEAFMK